MGLFSQPAVIDKRQIRKIGIIVFFEEILCIFISCQISVLFHVCVVNVFYFILLVKFYWIA